MGATGDTFRRMKRPLDYKTKVAIVYVLSLFMEIMDTTIVNVALPTLARDFKVGTAGIEWIVLGYLLSLAVWIPASGWLGDRIGTKKVFMFALAMFTGASILCGLSGSLNQLVAFRILQGVGGGMLTPVGAAMLYRAFPLEERAKAATAVLGVVVIAPAIGPVLGGVIVDSISWRWIFFVNGPIGLLAFILAYRFLQEHTEPDTGPFDVGGFLFSGAGITMILYAVSKGPSRGWTNPLILGPGIIGVILFVVLVVIELRIEHPMLHLRLLGERMFRRTNVIGLAMYGGFVGLLFLFPLYLQRLRGFSALESGLTQIPQAIGMILSSQMVGRKLYPTIGPRRLMVAGLLGGAVVGYGFSNLGLHTSLVTIGGLMFARGVSMTFIFIALQTAVYAKISTAETGRASSIFSTQRQMSSAFGVAIAATVLTTSMRSSIRPGMDLAAVQAAKLGAYRDGFMATALMFLVAAAAAMFINDADAAETLSAKAKVNRIRADEPERAAAHGTALE